MQPPTDFPTPSPPAADPCPIPARPRWPWGWLGLLTLLNLALRWGAIAHPQTLVFDEVYYAQFGLNYLQGQPFFDVHPPLGKYLIALSIRLFYQLFPSETAIAALTPETLNPLSYRWLNGLIGTCIPLLASWVAWEWSRGWPWRQRFTLLTGLLTSLDGFALVESRLALLHPALVAAGLGGVAAWGRSRSAQPGLHRWGWRSLCGLGLGAAMAVKWNGAGYGLALVLVEGWAVWARGGGVGEMPVLFAQRLRRSNEVVGFAAPEGLGGGWGDGERVPRGDGETNGWGWLRAGLGVMASAGVTYGGLWLPHLRLVQQSLLGIHGEIFQSHLALTQPHPYQSAWYTWPLLLRPMAYFYEPVELAGGDTGAIALYGLGNPLLWWLAAAAVLGLTMQGFCGGLNRVMRSLGGPQRQGGARGFGGRDRCRRPAARPPVLALIPTVYFVLWLPWAAIPRSTFIYHYQSSALMAEMGLAWLMAGWLSARKPSWRWAGWSLLGLMVTSFWFWLPLWLGWPLSLEALHQRWWLPSWI